MGCSRARHARPTSPAPANCWPLRRRRQNLPKPRSRPINSRPVLAAAGACASSRPSNGGCSRARRPALPQQPGRRRDPARFIPTPCRRLVAPANDNMCAHGLNRLFGRADNCRDHRNHLPTDLDIGLDRLETFLQRASNNAQRTSGPYNPASPKHQIPIRPALHTAGSFLGDFRTPNGIRNSSRQRNDRFGARRWLNQPFVHDSGMTGLERVDG